MWIRTEYVKFQTGIAYLTPWPSHVKSIHARSFNVLNLIYLFFNIKIWICLCRQSTDFSPVCVQASWKGYKQRKAYRDRLQTLLSNVQTVVKVNNLYH